MVNPHLLLAKRSVPFFGAMDVCASISLPTTEPAMPDKIADKVRMERLRRMSPTSRATYDRIVRLRKEIGRIDFDIVGSLREMRGD